MSIKWPEPSNLSVQIKHFVVGQNQFYQGQKLILSVAKKGYFSLVKLLKMTYFELIEYGKSCFVKKVVQDKE